MQLALCVVLCVGALVQASPSPSLITSLDTKSSPRTSNGGRFAGVGSTDAVIGQFPWQASITLDEARFCAGALLSEQWVLTAGQCVKGVASFNLALGTLAPGPLGDVDAVRMTSRSAILHPNFSESPLLNDIALIAIEYPGSSGWTPRVSPVRLPTRAQSVESFVNRAAVVAGWGASDDASAAPEPSLRFANASVMDMAFCLETYGGWVPVDTVICALGRNEASICQGDAGAPLLVRDVDDALTQVGVASFGVVGGCARNYPQSYTRVTAFLDWLAANGVHIDD